MDRLNRAELADFLRGRRALLQPADVGLETGRRRRTPGLRREEVARLAGISVDYYTRLEQARGPRPSRQVLDALARALRLSGPERAHLYHLSGEVPGPASGPPQEVRPGVLNLLDRLDETPAMVLDAKYDVLAWNPMAAALITDFSALPPERRNIIWRFFTDPQARARHDAEGGRQFARASVADLRAAAARYCGDAGIRRLVDRLLARSEEFAELWATHDVGVFRSAHKRLNHPAVGWLELECEALHVPECDQWVILYTAAPGSRSYEALRLLRSSVCRTLGPDPSPSSSIGMPPGRRAPAIMVEGANRSVGNPRRLS